MLDLLWIFNVLVVPNSRCVYLSFKILYFNSNMMEMFVCKYTQWLNEQKCIINEFSNKWPKNLALMLASNYNICYLARKLSCNKYHAYRNQLLDDTHEYVVMQIYQNTLSQCMHESEKPQRVYSLVIPQWAAIHPSSLVT